jgi:hypothetical protein
MRDLPPKPYRPRTRTPSGHDIPIPESVFHAIKSVEQGIAGLGQTIATNKADTDKQLSEVKELALKASAQSVERWTNLAKALVPAVIAIVGGVTGMAKLTERSAPLTPPPQESALSAELVKCQAKPEAEQRFCVANAYENDKLRRSGARP